MLLGYTDTGITDGDYSTFWRMGYLHVQLSAADVVLYAVVAEIVQHLAEDSPAAQQRDLLSRKRHSYALFLGAELQTFKHFLCKTVELNALILMGSGVLVQLGQGDDIIDKIDEPFGFAADISAELCNVLGLHHTACKHIRRSVDSSQRSFQLVGYI